ncbi:MAG TPA: peptidylprolyl isomerase [Flavobacteriales bacterium]|nr:peptidylprolyl isomerase [Flavobacteriales bacterium]
MLRLGFYLSLFILLFSCLNRSSSNGTSFDSKELKEPLIQENKKITKEESVLIDRYAERHEWKMNETGTGLRYMIYERGFGVQAKTGMRATVEYEIALLDGTVCYSSFEKGPRTFLIGRDNVESGIHEGITYLMVGDRAKLIVPSYLAHGLSGDQNKIPPRATLVVDLHLVGVD